MNYFLDSNVFVRYFAKESDLTVYEDCFKLIKALKEGRFRAYTSHIVFAEVIWVLRSVYKISRSESVEVIKSLNSLSGLKLVDKFQTYKATQFYEESSIKYIDALIASISQIQNRRWTVVSYDKDFDKLKILRKEPGQVALTP